MRKKRRLQHVVCNKLFLCNTITLLLITFIILVWALCKIFNKKAGKVSHFQSKKKQTCNGGLFPCRQIQSCDLPKSDAQDSKHSPIARFLLLLLSEKTKAEDLWTKCALIFLNATTFKADVSIWFEVDKVWSNSGSSMPQAKAYVNQTKYCILPLWISKKKKKV